MMQAVIGFVLKELRQTLRDKRMRVLLFVAPCLQLTVFGLALSTETRNVRLATISKPADAELADIREKALASGWFVPAKEPRNNDPYSWIRSGHADAVLVAPAEGLAEARERGEGALQLLVDGSNVTRAAGINFYLSQIIGGALNSHPKQGQPSDAASPIDFKVRVLYNPSLRSAVYLVPGVMSVITCLITILLTSMSIAREKEIGTFETIIAAPVSSGQVILGKTLPYVLLGLANLPLVLGIAVLIFEVPMRGSFLMLLGASFIFICATVSIGILISTITKSQQQAMMGGFIYLMPSLLTSGLLSPVATMPDPLKLVAYSNPITYYMELLRNIMLKGGDPGLFTRNIMIMCVMTLVLGFISMRRFRTTL